MDINALLLSVTLFLIVPGFLYLCAGLTYAGVALAIIIPSIWVVVTLNIFDTDGLRLPTHAQFFNEHFRLVLGENGRPGRAIELQVETPKKRSRPQKSMSPPETSLEKSTAREAGALPKRPKCLGGCSKVTGLHQPKCGHAFCFNCIADLIPSQNLNNRCPKCGAQLWRLPEVNGTWVAKSLLCIVLLAVLANLWTSWQAVFYLYPAQEYRPQHFFLVVLLIVSLLPLWCVKRRMATGREWWHRCLEDAMDWPKLGLLGLLVSVGLVAITIYDPCWLFLDKQATCTAQRTLQDFKTGLQIAWPILRDIGSSYAYSTPASLPTAVDPATAEAVQTSAATLLRRFW